MLECVINVSEGRERGRLDQLADAAGTALLDLHADPHHHRAVLTLAGEEEAVWAAATAVARRAVAVLDLGAHAGVHPRFGVLDVVPWVDLDDASHVTPCALRLRDRFAQWAGDELALPCFTYGPERSLPEVRRGAWKTLGPDTGPPQPHPTAGSCAVGARIPLVAYNLWLLRGDIDEARRIAAAIRRPGLRALGLQVGHRVQVSCNLTDPIRLGPAEAYALVSARAPVAGAEVVGLVPESVLAPVPRERWPGLDLDPDRTIEKRLAARH